MATGIIIDPDKIGGRRLRRLYLMRWNPNSSSYTRDMFDKDFATFQNGDCIEDMNWTIREWQDVQYLDLFLLAQVGTENDGIVGGGYIESDPYTYTYDDGHVGHTRYVDVSFLFLQKIEKRKLLTAESLSQACPEIDWHKGHSGVLIPADVAERLTLHICNELVREDEDENLVYENFEEKHYSICTLIGLLCPQLKNQLAKEGRYRSETAPDYDILDVSVGYEDEKLGEHARLEDVLFLEMGGWRM